MKLNHSMKCLFEKYKIDSLDKIPQNSAYPVWARKDKNGRTYWGISHFWNLDKDEDFIADRDLSQLEWDGNELYLDAENDRDVQDILKSAVGILKFWKYELETKYPKTSFCLFASYDNGDMQILDEGDSPAMSVTLRFWADRGSDNVINLSAFDDWEQPAIIEYCNF